MEAERYLLGCLNEELAEQIQEVNKISRFGANHVCPVSHKTNATKFGDEVNDGEAIKLMLNGLGLKLPMHVYDPARVVSKIQRTLKYAEYSVQEGRLSAQALKMLNEVARAFD